MPKLTDVLAALRAVRRRALDGSLRPTDDVRAALDDVLALLGPLAAVHVAFDRVVHYGGDPAFVGLRADVALVLLGPRTAVDAGVEALAALASRTPL